MLCYDMQLLNPQSHTSFCCDMTVSDTGSMENNMPTLTYMKMHFILHALTSSYHIVRALQYALAPSLMLKIGQDMSPLPA